MEDLLAVPGKAPGDVMILGPPVGISSLTQACLLPPGNSVMKLHCCSLFRARVTKTLGSVSPPLPVARLGTWGSMQAVLQDHHPEPLGLPTTVSLNRGPDPAVSLGRVHTAAQQVCAE